MHSGEMYCGAQERRGEQTGQRGDEGEGKRGKWRSNPERYVESERTREEGERNKEKEGLWIEGREKE